MDLEAPLIHEFTYQAMAHDLLAIKETDKIYYKTILNEGKPDQQEKEMEIGEKDEIWVKNRHMHMKDTIERLMGDFQKFIDENPHFTNESGDATSLNAIKDMLAGLPQFQELKEAYSLHLSMAQECMNIFQQHKLPDVASVEQTLATGLDEDYRKPKHIADQVVRLLDDDNVGPSERLRLVMLYVLYRDGVIPDDVQRLLAHANLPPREAEIVSNLELIGGHPTRFPKDNRPLTQPLFPRKTTPTAADEEYALSRFEPALKKVLQELARGTLEPSLFPYTKPPMAGEADMVVGQASLRSAKPTWAQNRKSLHESKQRIIVFMAGGATYSEARSCYEVSQSAGKDVFLATSHMLTPALFLQQVGDLSVDRRQLDLPLERPPPKVPAHFYEPEPQPRAPAGQAPPSANNRGKSAGAALKPPTVGAAAMSLNSGAPRPRSSNGTAPAPSSTFGKLEKKHKDGEEKKKRHFFSSRK